MKYELDSDLKNIEFWCDKAQNYVSYSGCMRCRASQDKRACWEKALRDDIKLDCDVENERNAEGVIHCPICGSKDILSTAFNHYMCCSCDAFFTYSVEQLKPLMGNEYKEIDQAELNAEFSKI